MAKVKTWPNEQDIPENYGEVVEFDGFTYVLVIAECACRYWQVSLPAKEDGSFGHCGYCHEEVRRGTA